MKNKTAFSLIELSVVLVIIAVFISTSMPVAVSVITNYRTRITNERIQAVYQAMGGFVKAYRRLPCPASMLLAKGNANYGKEVTCGSIPYSAGSSPAASSGVWESNSSNNVVFGMVPVQALGLTADMAEDGFGSKLSYTVIRGYTNSSTFGTQDPSTFDNNVYSGASYVSTSSSKIHVHEKFGATAVDSANNEAILVILSHGANKYGAFPAGGTSQNTASFTASDFPADSSDEGFNMLRVDSMSYSYTGPTAYFYNYGDHSGTLWTPYMISSDSETFDDIVFYKSLNQLVADFSIYDLVYCSFDASQAITYGSAYTFNWYGTLGANLNTKYGNIVTASSLDGSSSATTECPSGYRRGATRPSKKCGRFGVWESDVVDHCVKYTQP